MRETSKVIGALAACGRLLAKAAGGAPVLALALACATAPAALVRAAELKSIAILAPEAPTDFGWNQQGVLAAEKAAEKAGIEVRVAAHLGYDDVRPVLRELAEDGAGLLIAHASGYNTSGPEIGEELGVPVAITDRPEARVPGKVADYTISGHEGAYLAGRLAAKLTRTGTLGIVTSGEPPGWNVQSAAFAQGARAEKPDIVIRYAVIGPAAYSDAAGARRVTETVIAAGADIIFGQGNGSSFGMLAAIEATPAADGGKVWFIDVIGDKTPIDKGHLLSSVIWNFEPIFSAMIADVKAGTFGEKNYGIGLRDGSVSLLKTPHIPEEVWHQILAVRNDILDGDIVLTPVFDAASVHALVNTATTTP